MIGKADKPHFMFPLTRSLKAPSVGSSQIVLYLCFVLLISDNFARMLVWDSSEAHIRSLKVSMTTKSGNNRIISSIDKGDSFSS